MREKGVVLNCLESDLYEVSLKPDQKACLSCVLKKECHSNNIIIAKSTVIREVGEEITVNISEKSELFRILIVFLIPLIFGILGSLMSFLIFFPKKSFFAFLGFIIFFFLSFFLVRILDNKLKSDLPVIL